MVEWYLGEEMMNHVEIDDLMEEVSSYEANTSINGSECALHERPSLVGVVWYVWVSVMEVCDSNY